jgi:hypothetical protein
VDEREEERGEVGCELTAGLDIRTDKLCDRDK